jgi:hypothetical protein
MELHMDSDAPYELDYAVSEGRAVHAELLALLAEPALKRDGGRLLRVLGDIAGRGRGAAAENVHLPSTSPPLHSVVVGLCAAFYAYAPRAGGTAMFLLGFYRKGEHWREVGTAAARLAGLGHVPGLDGEPGVGGVH